MESGSDSDLDGSVESYGEEEDLYFNEQQQQSRSTPSMIKQHPGEGNQPSMLQMPAQMSSQMSAQIPGMPSNYMQGMMPYHSMMAMQSQMQQIGSSSQSGYAARTLSASPGVQDVAGFPLNLQTTRDERPPSRPNQNLVPPPAHSNFSSVRNPSPMSHGPSQMSHGSYQVAPNSSQSQTHQQQMGNMLDVQGSGAMASQDYANRPTPSPKSVNPPPPKRPLTPYMRFSKSMWQQVKAGNQSMSICEVGSTIGRMWRELPDEEKQKHNDDFTLDKVRYDNELKDYLKSTGLHASDLVKTKAKKKESAPKPAPVRRATPAAAQPRSTTAPTNVQDGQLASNQQLAQAFMRLPSVAGMGSQLPVGVGMPLGMLSGFPQMWAAAGQQYPTQQQMIASMNMASQLQLAQQQGLYNSSGAAPLSDHGLAPTGQLMTNEQAASMYLYSQNFM